MTFHRCTNCSIGANMAFTNVYKKGWDNNKAMTREELIDLIESRIKSEYKKHGDLDWAGIAARKIYGSLEGVLDVGKEREDSVMMSLYGLIGQQGQTIDCLQSQNENMQGIINYLEELLNDKDKSNA